MPLPPDPVPLSTLLADIPGARVDGDASVRVSSVTRDSRDAGPGAVFVAVTGAKVDGHTFVPAVRAAAVVVEREDVRPAAGVVQVVVPDTKRALAWLSAALWGHPGRHTPIVGVTGTNGKTTITTLLEQAAGACGLRAGRIGTTGTSIAERPVSDAAFTTPEAPELQRLLASMAGCDLVAMEVSSIGLAQHRVDGIPFALGVFTNLTQDHLDFHGTMDAYRRAKARLFEELLGPARSGSPRGGPRAILFADDPAHREMGAPADAWTYGFSEGADLRIREVRLAVDGTELDLATPDGPVTLRTPLVGRHNAANVTAAFAALRALGVEQGRAAEGIARVRGAPGRLERVPDPHGRLVLVDYAHSEDALANVLPAVRELTRGRVFVVFGCGGDRDRGKRPRMGEVAARLADVVVVTSDNPRTEDPGAIIAQVVEGIPRGRADVHVEPDREAAIRGALAMARRGDAVLLAGKGHEAYQEVDGVRRPFDDREVAWRVMEVP
jgi:UDP-N-acetylmuramoyl-L-alanyl-D-glutamate--2,6-diaminopimelate ligase